MVSAMNAIQTYLRTLDDAWQHPWESLETILEGLTEEEAAWRPPGYEELEREEGWPEPASIAWHLAHLTACKREYACRVRDVGRPADLADAEFEPAGDLRGWLADLREAHAFFRREISLLHSEDLGHKVGGELPLAEFLAMAIRHDSWHGGQIAVMRRFFQNQDEDGED
jgi:uncharacterized damage-inducible protein DinB